MTTENKSKASIHCGGRGIIWLILALCTANIGHNIHGSIFWAVMDFFFMPLAWLKWIVCQEVSVTIIKQSFAWFLQ